MTAYPTPTTVCRCGMIIDCSHGPESRPPVPGDVSICKQCAQLYRFAVCGHGGLVRVPLTLEQLQAMDRNLFAPGALELIERTRREILGKQN